MKGKKGKIGIAVVGLGRVAAAHLDAIQLNSKIAQLVAVVDIDELRSKSVAAKYNVRSYTNVEAALDDSDIDAMLVCLPHDLHKSVSIQIMDTDRHVLVEKPLATSVEDGKEMVRKAHEKRVVLMVGQSHRFYKALLETKRTLKDTIGDPFNLLYLSLRPFNQMAWPAWWQDESKTGGLAFPMLGSHTVDFTLWIYEGRKPLRVFSEARSIHPKLKGMNEIVMIISFDDGSMATNCLSMNTSPSRKECLIVGSKGTIHFSHSPSSSGLLGVFTCDLSLNGKQLFSGEPEPHNFALQMREFCEAILHEREPMVRNSEVLTQLAVIEAAKQSAQLQRPVSIDYPNTT